MNTPIETKILKARTSLLWDHPFFGALIVQLRLVDATDDPRIMTMATDGVHLYFHEPFVEAMNKLELLFVCAHEVLHNALEHHIRRGNRDAKLWNMAADYAINFMLVEAKVGTMPKGGLLDARFSGMGAEEIYRILEDEQDKNSGGANAASDPGGCGQILDASPTNNPGEIAEARAEMQTKVRQAAQIANGLAAGNLPAGLKSLIEELTKPRVDWRATLRRFIDQSLTREYSWARPNRRFLHSGLVLPGTRSSGISHMVVAVDTSGSIDKEILTAFASEIDAAFAEGSIDKMTVIYADADVQKIEVFEAGDEIKLDPKGGGGTAFSPTFEWIQENAADAAVMIYFTDLYVSDFGEEPVMPVLWAVYGDSRQFEKLAANAPFGEAVSLAA